MDRGGVKAPMVGVRAKVQRVGCVAKAPRVGGGAKALRVGAESSVCVCVCHRSCLFYLVFCSHFF